MVAGSASYLSGFAVEELRTTPSSLTSPSSCAADASSHYAPFSFYLPSPDSFYQLTLNWLRSFVNQRVCHLWSSSSAENWFQTAHSTSASSHWRSLPCFSSLLSSAPCCTNWATWVRLRQPDHDCHSYSLHHFRLRRAAWQSWAYPCQSFCFILANHWYN